MFLLLAAVTVAMMMWNKRSPTFLGRADRAPDDVTFFDKFVSV